MIKDDYLINKYVMANFPLFPCPSCESTLHPTFKNPLFHEESAGSKAFQESGEGDIDNVEGVFSLHLRCGNTKCAEDVFCVGNFTMTPDESPIDETLSYVPSLEIRFFNPPIPIFPIHPKLKSGHGLRVGKALEESFSLFWSNPSGAGNSLRTAVEALMDYRAIKKEGLTLHARLEIFKKSFKANHPALADLGDKLLAIKWIGNSGSHISGLTRENMIHAYKLFANVIDELFNNTSAKLSATAKAINRTKKPI